VDCLTADAIRAARLDAGWSFTQAARELKRHSQEPLPAVDSIVRSWKRWEKGTAPSRQYQPLLRRMLGVGIGSGPNDNGGSPDLSGQWYAAWQTWKDGVERVAVQRVRFTQDGDALGVVALERGCDMVDGGYLWRGELRLWDNEHLMGWYAADDGAVRSKGTMFFTLHTHGLNMSGRWVGASFDGPLVTGCAAMARTETEVRQLIELLTLKEGAPL
jgi:hypothetical protein